MHMFFVECHLQVFKAFDAKIAEHTFVQLDQEVGLRHVVAQEFFSADKKIWGAISNLYSQGSWSFEECLHEMTVVRSDISSLLQPRPRIPKQLPPTSWPKRQRSQRERRRQRKGWKRKNKILHLRQEETSAPMASTITRKLPYAWSIMPESVKRGDSCPYFHACSARLQSGRPCMQQHAAKDHRGSTWLESDYDTASHLQSPEVATDINSHPYNQDTTSDTTPPPSVTPPITLFTSPEKSSQPLIETSLQQDQFDPAIAEPFLQNLFDCFLTFLLDTQLPLPVLQKLQILIIFHLLILSSMLLATSLMTTCLRTFWNLHIQDSLGQFGLPHLAVLFNT